MPRWTNFVLTKGEVDDDDLPLPEHRIFDDNGNYKRLVLRLSQSKHKPQSPLRDSPESVKKRAALKHLVASRILVASDKDSEPSVSREISPLRSSARASSAGKKTASPVRRASTSSARVSASAKKSATPAKRTTASPAKRSSASPTRASAVSAKFSTPAEVSTPARKSSASLAKKSATPARKTATPARASASAKRDATPSKKASASPVRPSASARKSASPGKKVSASPAIDMRAAVAHAVVARSTKSPAPERPSASATSAKRSRSHTQSPRKGSRSGSRVLSQSQSKSIRTSPRKVKLSQSSKASPKGTPSPRWSITDLKDFAKENAISVKGLRLKADILSAIEKSN